MSGWMDRQKDRRAEMLTSDSERAAQLRDAFDNHHGPMCPKCRTIEAAARILLAQLEADAKPDGVKVLWCEAHGERAHKPKQGEQYSGCWVRDMGPVPCQVAVWLLIPIPDPQPERPLPQWTLTEEGWVWDDSIPDPQPATEWGPDHPSYDEMGQ